MAAPLVECIPNFSDARRPEVIDQILESIREVSGVYVLDRHSDLDHNRTVITFAGPPEAVEEAAFRSIAAASRLIDLDEHAGEHPRIGAADVVPFVPLAEVTMTDCVEMARRLGRRVGTELGIPVYLYEEAATRPDRQNLENIRRGEYEALKIEIETDPSRKPDFGPSTLGKAGATVIGARQPLIAYNVYLNTDDVTIAQKIAAVVRHSGGGLRYVKALGLLVDGRAQVSMNLTNYRQTSVPRVVEMVRREAQRFGTAVHHCELVGLIPQEALVDSARWYLQLDQFQPEQILESRLYAALAQKPLPVSSEAPDFLDDLAAGTAAPGGGSAAAYTGASAAALAAMVARLTVGKKKYADLTPRMYEIIERAEELRKSLTAAVERDSAGFAAVMDALHLPKDTPAHEEARTRAVETANLQAAVVPLEVARMAAETLMLCVELAQTANLNAISDAATGASLARAALTAAALNVRTNTRGAPGHADEVKNHPCGSRKCRKPGGAPLQSSGNYPAGTRRAAALLIPAVKLTLRSPHPSRIILPAAALCMGLILIGCTAQAVPTPRQVIPTYTAAPSSTPQPLPTATSTHKPFATFTSAPTLTLTPTIPPCIEAVCIEPGHFFLSRPVNGVLGDAIDPTYRYASTRTGTTEVHTGVEMPAAFGQDVRAAAAGKVVAAGTDHDVQYGAWKDYYGSLVILEHEFPGYPKIYSLYAHLSSMAVTLGQKVAAGEIIAQVGASGAATGPHLHFEVRSTSTALKNIRNPELWLEPHVWAGQPGGAIAGLVTGFDGKPRKVESITIQPLDSAGQPFGLASYLATYDNKMGRGDDRWYENFALGDLAAGSYLVSFVDLGKVWRQNVTVQPGNVTRVAFRVE